LPEPTAPCRNRPSPASMLRRMADCLSGCGRSRAWGLNPGCLAVEIWLMQRPSAVAPRPIGRRRRDRCAIRAAATALRIHRSLHRRPGPFAVRACGRRADPNTSCLANRSPAAPAQPTQGPANPTPADPTSADPRPSQPRPSRPKPQPTPADPRPSQSPTQQIEPGPGACPLQTWPRQLTVKRSMCDSGCCHSPPDTSITSPSSKRQAKARPTRACPERPGHPAPPRSKPAAALEQPRSPGPLEHGQDRRR
jgi:hypothetical protein